MSLISNWGHYNSYNDCRRQVENWVTPLTIMTSWNALLLNSILRLLEPNLKPILPIQLHFHWSEHISITKQWNSLTFNHTYKTRFFRILKFGLVLLCFMIFRPFQSCVVNTNVYLKKESMGFFYEWLTYLLERTWKQDIGD